MNVPYRAYIAREYVGEREKDYKQELEHRSVVAIWGKPGIGKTWVGAKLAIQWESAGFVFAPYSGPPRQAFWIECKKTSDFYELVMEIAELLQQRGQEHTSSLDASKRVDRETHPQIDLARLRQLIMDHFNDSELRNLCFDLRIDYDNLGGLSKEDKIRELVLHFERRNKLYELLLACYQRRPKAPWRDTVLGPLAGQRQMTLWHWLQSRPTRVPSPKEIIGRLTEQLNQSQHLFCFDDFHHVSSDPNIQLLFKELERGLNKTATKVLLVGRHKPEIEWIGGRELKDLTRTDIQNLVLALNIYGKPWLNEAIAAKFADRLIELVGVNLKLMDIVAINWLRSHTTQADAENYLDALDKAQIAELVLKHGDDLRNAVLVIFSALEGWQDHSTLLDIASGYVKGTSADEFAQAMDTLLDAKLIQKDGDKYRLHGTVQELCQQRLANQRQDLADLHRCVADAYVRKANWLLAIDHYMEAQAFSTALQLLVEHTLEVTRAGGGERASEQLETLRRIAGTDRLSLRDMIWEQILTADLRAWLGEIDAAQTAAELGLQIIIEKIPRQERPAYQYEEGRLKARLGTILPEKEKFEEGIRLLEESKNLMQAGIWERDITYQTSKVQPLLAVFNNLGLAHRLLAQGRQAAERAASFEKAVRFYTDSINMGEAFTGTPQIDYTVAWALVGLSQVYDDRNENSDRILALKKAQDGLERFQEIDHQWGVGFANRTLGTIYFRLGDYERAANFRRQGLTAAYQCDDRQAIILTNAGLAEIYIFEGDLEAARACLKAAKKVLDIVSIPWLSKRVSRFEQWTEGVNLVQKGKLAEGERILRDVLRDFRKGGPDYAVEASLVEQQLKDFGCSVSEPETKAPTLPPPPPEPQDRIGRYQLRAELGKGAMGTVYQAYDPHTDRS